MRRELIHGLLVAALATPVAAQGLRVKELKLTPEQLAEPILIDCPIAQETRLQLPGPLKVSKISPATKAAFGIERVASEPLGVYRFRPTTHPAKAAIRVWTMDGQELTFVLQTLERGTPSEARVTIVAPSPTPVKATASPVPTAVPTSSPTPTAAPTSTPAATAKPKLPVAPTRTPVPRLSPAPPRVVATPAPSPPAPTPTAAPTVEPTPQATVEPSPVPRGTQAPTSAAGSAQGTVDLEQFALSGKPVKLNEVQGLPGQHRCVLEEARQGNNKVLFRFRLVGGKDIGVKAVRSPEGPLSTYLAGPDGDDMIVLVELPKELWKKKSGLEITFSNGVTYKFRLRNPGLLRFLDDMKDAITPF